MSQLALRMEGVAKKYTIGGSSGGYGRLSETLWNAMRRPLKGPGNRAQGEDLWALKDVSLEVTQGEILGVIGSNGAGKTTLLKVLSRITEPTRGVIEFRGRVGALLEVGTGFHPELSGRENIFLNGAILGMGRREIRQKFDEIVSFAEVERFLETPVKRYSSGMYVRLAFAVAAHLEPDILLVDEVLAVGDADFQKKSLGKMNEVAGEGRTVLFVSHNMGILQEVASRGLWLHRGHLVFDGNLKDAVYRYLSSTQQVDAEVDLTDHPGRTPASKRLMRSARLADSAGRATTDFLQTDSIVLEIQYEAPEGLRLAGAGFGLYSIGGVKVAGFNNYMVHPPPYKIPPRGIVTFTLAPGQLTPGSYAMSLSLGSHPSVLEDKVENAISFNVHSADVYGTGYLLTPEDGVTALRGNAVVDVTPHIRQPMSGLEDER